MSKIFTSIFNVIFYPITSKELIILTIISPFLGLIIGITISSIVMPKEIPTTHVYMGFIGFVAFPPVFFIFNLFKLVSSSNKEISDIDYYQDVEDIIPANNNDIMQKLEELNQLYIKGEIDIPTYNKNKQDIIKNFKSKNEAT